MCNFCFRIVHENVIPQVSWVKVTPGLWEIQQYWKFCVLPNNDKKYLMKDFITKTNGFSIYPLISVYLQECDPGYYGHGCTAMCSEHCSGNDKACNHINGTCDMGCDPGYQGDLCIQGDYDNNTSLMPMRHFLYEKLAWIWIYNDYFQSITHFLGMRKDGVFFLF